MNHSSHAYYNDHQRSLSTTTQVNYPAAQQYTVYPPASSSYVTDEFYASPDAQQMVYANQQSQEYPPSMPASSHPMVNSASFPGSTGQQQLLQPLYSDSRSMSAPARQTYSDHPAVPSAHYTHYPSQYPLSQHTRNHQHPSHPRYQPTPALILPSVSASSTSSAHSSSTSLRRPSSSSTSPSTPYHHPQHHHHHPASSHLPPSPGGTERYPCDKCDKTFSRSHDRKRHYESQHSAQPTSHRCPYCKKEFSRADSMKRHVDNGCEKDPGYAG
ncbi:hypothetical protein BC835DRAFT_1396861 [Cytidiella melzeri]|nr:hypothetical protein BC835DRAFT_1396861 [Cytidiella melzeri]